MENRRQFLKNTAMITAAGLGGVANRVGAASSRRDSSGAGEPVRSEDTGAPYAGSERKDIRKLSQHFNEPNGDISPWMFVPEDNIKEISTADHPGLVTIWQAGEGKDIKGILMECIRTTDYTLPWEFELALTQNYWVQQGVGDPQQNNYAMGLNLAVTFSDPSEWPADRNQQPPDTHSFQLFVVHLGSTGEFAPGLPQFAAPDRDPQAFLVWGRGDLDDKLTGNWNIPYEIVVNGISFDILTSGAGASQVFFRVFVASPTRIGITIKFAASDWGPFTWIDCSRFGKITGVWELGPVFSCDRWIPDRLAKELPILRHVSNPPKVIAPNPIYEFYVDYCVFMYAYPAAPFEHYSDDFDIPGYIGGWQFQSPFSAETWSNPGYLTITLLGPSQGMWFCPKSNMGSEYELKYYPPPWEIETCFIAPDDAIPWNLLFQHKLYDSKGRMIGYWRPGVQNFPKERRHRYTNSPFTKSVFDVHMETYLKAVHRVALKSGFQPVVHVEFEPDVPEGILSHKPLYMLYQLIDPTHVRIGFKAKPGDPWYLSKAFDLSSIAEGGIGGIGEVVWMCATGRHYSLPPGSPMYQKLLIDYVHYRRGRTT